jgi:hypothetical protein
MVFYEVCCFYFILSDTAILYYLRSCIVICGVLYYYVGLFVWLHLITSSDAFSWVILIPAKNVMQTLKLIKLKGGS